MTSTPKFSVIGLGRIGICVSAALSERGVRVLGVDTDPNRVRALTSNDPDSDEQGLNEMLRRNHVNLSGTEDYNIAIMNTSVSYVIVPTPAAENGSFNLTFVTQAFDAIGNALRFKNAYHLVVLGSTVLPGSIRNVLLLHLERSSGKTCGRDFGLCYSPPFVALSSVIRDFLHPHFTLIGEYDKRSGDLLSEYYQVILGNTITCKRMSIENAEITKLAVNTFVTMKIAYANMLADICEAVPEGNIDVVSDAVGSDHRIGSHCLRGGLGYGGPCFPRDNSALSYFARQLGISAGLALTTNQENSRRPETILQRLPVDTFSGKIIALLGLGYKHGSRVLDESQSVSLARLLLERGAVVRAFDVQIDASIRQTLCDGIFIANSLGQCILDAELVFILTPHRAFQEISSMLSAQSQKSVIVVDVWRMVSHPEEMSSHIRYFALGRCSDAPSATKHLKRMLGHDTK